MTSDFKETSYRRHREQYERHAEGGALSGEAGVWLREDTADAWRHRRMHQLVDPLLEGVGGSAWLTVGDGRYGREAHYILEKGHRAVASDISDTLLKEGAAAGYITRYSRQNAEALGYEDGAFDYVLCKESWHHFPRPFKALYEMIRVARRGVVLIEPTDLKIGATLRWKIFRALVDGARKITGSGGGHQLFEESGNYVYGISRQEMEKVALGLNMPTVAFRGINDFFMEGLGREPGDRSSLLFRRMRRRIALNDLFCRLGLKPHSKTCAVLFPQPPEEALRRRLREAGFDVVDLPENPYIKRRG